MKIESSNLFFTAALCLALTAAVVPELAVAQSGSSEGGRQRPGRGGPPPQEAFDACASLAANDSCSVQTPDEMLEGSCQQAPREEQLLCVPAR